MREILFRGKHYSSKKWVYGSLVTGGLFGDAIDKPWIFCHKKQGFINVIPKTVGQLHEGLTKKIGKNVFEGDTINYDLLPGLGLELRRGCKGVVHYFDSTEYLTNVFVTGNIHDNPELLNT